MLLILWIDYMLIIHMSNVVSCECECDLTCKRTSHVLVLQEWICTAFLSSCCLSSPRLALTIAESSGIRTF